MEIGTKQTTNRPQIKIIPNYVYTHHTHWKTTTGNFACMANSDTDLSSKPNVLLSFCHLIFFSNSLWYKYIVCVRPDKFARVMIWNFRWYFYHVLRESNLWSVSIEQNSSYSMHCDSSATRKITQNLNFTARKFI